MSQYNEYKRRKGLGHMRRLGRQASEADITQITTAVAVLEPPRPSQLAAQSDGQLAVLLTGLLESAHAEIAVVAEVMGGVEPAGTYVLELLRTGRPVVTANKQLVARRGAELFEAAATGGVQLRFEASVCAAIPVIKVLRESLVGNRVSQMAVAAAEQCGRGMVNFRKAFKRDNAGRYIGVVEFRVFAGTLNIHKILHHLGSVLGLCRRAHQVECLGGFGKNKVQQKRTATATDGLRFLWDYLGWTGSKRPVALGLVGPLHSEFKHYRKIADRMCRRFDSRFPYANL